MTEIDNEAIMSLQRKKMKKQQQLINALEQEIALLKYEIKQMKKSKNNTSI